MKEYKINRFYYYMDGYERVVEIQENSRDANKWVVYFVEYDEYLEWGEKSIKRKEGDIIIGDIFVNLAFLKEKTDKDMMFVQNVPKSSQIEAVVEVSKIIDEYSIYAISTIIEDEILIEFEKKIQCEVGDKILVHGSLELKMD